MNKFNLLFMLRFCRIKTKRCSLYTTSNTNRDSNQKFSFVSKHYQTNETEVRAVVDSMNTPTRIGPEGRIEVKECKLCPKGNRSNLDNLWKLYIRPNGSYYCFRCSLSGSFYDMKRRLYEYRVSDASIHSSSLSSSSSSSPLIPANTTNRTQSNHTTISYDQILSMQPKFREFSSRLFPLSSLGKSITGNNNNNTNNTTNSNTSNNISSTIDERNVLATRKYLFENRELRQDTLMKYGVGITTQQFQDEQNKWVDKVCITFPWIRKVDTLAIEQNEGVTTSKGTHIIERVKCRALETKGLQRLLPKGGPWGFFGWHLIHDNHKEVIITEGEYDAMAVSQALSDLELNHPLKDIPTISLPNGCSSLPVELIPQLERFEKIYLWLDNDKPGIENSDKIAKKLGLNRCYIVRPDPNMSNPPKDANDALRQSNGFELIPLLLQQAKLCSHQKVASFSDMKSDLLRIVLSDKITNGTSTPSLPKLTEICKGFRRGEVVILTGPTGSGKTTILSQLSVDFVKQGMPTLWGSFEIKNDILMKKMLLQYAKTDIKTVKNEELTQIVNDFEMLPMKFMNFYGGSDVDEIFEVMDQAVYQDDINHIIIDNLQFMTPRPYQQNPISTVNGNPYLKFEIQDYILDRFRKFASEKNVNVIIVIHPRKEEDNTYLSLSSISGSSKAGQEADIVLILQKVNNNTYLDVKKNRYDGKLGNISLGFDTDSFTFHEIHSTRSTIPPPSSSSSSSSSSRL